LGWVVNSNYGKNSLAAAKSLNEKMLDEAKLESENLKKEKMLEADDEIFNKRQQMDDEFKNKKKSLEQFEVNLTNRENDLDRKADLIEKKEREIFLRRKEQVVKENQLNTQKKRLDGLLHEQNEKLEQISGLTREKAKEILMQNLLEDAKEEASSKIYKIMENAKKEAEAQSKNIVISAIQQTAGTFAVESTVSSVSLPADDMKGRIIGREGRNIRAFEVVTGADVIVDDTPEQIILSCFDPYRRELARITMEKLVNDGRIHPGRIEETYDKTIKEMEQYFVELGEQALLETGVHIMNFDIIQMIGKLRFRTSFGQNVLQHSKEVSLISGIIAAELELDESMAKRAGLLHDIGKAVERNSEGSHSKIGYEFAKKHGEHPIIQNAIAGHHGGVELISPIGVIVQIANDISSVRPGARREVVQNFINRMESLEEIAQSFDGVMNSYVIQTGKEVRVIVDHEKVDDANIHQLASDIAQKIQKDVEYPGQVKVTTIREFRAFDFA
jgi:ribonuclease Y